MIDVAYVDGEADAKREHTIALGVFKSMMSNGDGKSRKHAFVVISVAEEYELMGRCAGTAWGPGSFMT